MNQLLDGLWQNETAVYPDGEPFVEALRSGTMSVELFAPRGDDLQEPHDQDELYLIIQGRASLHVGEDEIRCGTGDAVMVPALVEHRFVDMSDDFMCWAVFWGPPGGENRG